MCIRKIPCGLSDDENSQCEESHSISSVELKNMQCISFIVLLIIKKLAPKFHRGLGLCLGLHGLLSLSL